MQKSESNQKSNANGYNSCDESRTFPMVPD